MRMLIALDGSRFAEAVLTPAAELAARSAAEVHLVEVVKESLVHATLVNSPSIGHALRDEYEWPIGEHLGLSEFPLETVMPVESMYQAEDRTRQVAEDYLNSVVQDFFPDGARIEVVLGENPAQEIIKCALRENVELIALATHGRTGLAKLMMGSVAAELLKAHVAPLFLVRPAELQFAVSTNTAETHETR